MMTCSQGHLDGHSFGRSNNPPHCQGRGPSKESCHHRSAIHPRTSPYASIAAWQTGPLEVWLVLHVTAVRTYIHCRRAVWNVTPSPPSSCHVPPVGLSV